jgi:hypothetical protein
MKFVRYTTSSMACKDCPDCEEGSRCQHPNEYQVGVFKDSEGDLLYRAVEPFTKGFYHKGKFIKDNELPWPK